MEAHVFIFAGEPSGDVHGGHLLKALKRLMPHLHATGVGGPQLRAQGLEAILPMEAFEVMGFTDVLLSFPRLFRQFHVVKRHILETRPKVVVLVDYPGFNLRLAKALRKAGYKGKIVQYISPTVWAHGKKRIQQMASTLDLLMTIYPFEATCYTATALEVAYIGNPLQEYVQDHPYETGWQKQIGLPAGGRLLSLFPGSRKGEIDRNLPKLLATAERLKEEDPEALIAISCAHEETFKQMKLHLENSPLRLNLDTFLVPKRYTYEMMRDSHAAIAKSGTVTLELALHRCPTVVIYQLTGFNRLMAKWVMRLKLPHYCIVNILANQGIFPELIAKKFTEEEIWLQLKELWKPGHAREICQKGCDSAQALLDKREASIEGASLIRKLLEEP
ncbi:MAG: lipid-A-disaccharide synthase [Parachlamydia sp.]|nr:lipid-A-disaccharide synthase [Parachlamydia sp.]